MKDFLFKNVLRQDYATHRNMKSRYIYFKNFKTSLKSFLQTYVHQNRQCQFIYINKTKFKVQATAQKSENHFLFGDSIYNTMGLKYMNVI